MRSHQESVTRVSFTQDCGRVGCSSNMKHLMHAQTRYVPLPTSHAFRIPLYSACPPSDAHTDDVMARRAHRHRRLYKAVAFILSSLPNTTFSCTGDHGPYINPYLTAYTSMKPFSSSASSSCGPVTLPYLRLYFPRSSAYRFPMLLRRAVARLTATRTNKHDFAYMSVHRIYSRSIQPYTYDACAIIQV